MNATAGNADAIRGLNMLLMKIRHRNTKTPTRLYLLICMGSTMAARRGVEPLFPG